MGATIGSPWPPPAITAAGPLEQRKRPVTRCYARFWPRSPCPRAAADVPGDAPGRTAYGVPLLNLKAWMMGM